MQCHLWLFGIYHIAQFSSYRRLNQLIFPLCSSTKKIQTHINHVIFTSVSVAFCSNLEQKTSRLNSPKQGKSDSCIMISRMYRIESTCRLSSINPWKIKTLKYINIFESLPPINSMYSLVSLKGADSKFMPPGEKHNIKPKSIWIM